MENMENIETKLDITKLAGRAARKVVTACDHMPTLEGWASQEERTLVKDAIEARMRKLRRGIKPGETEPASEPAEEPASALQPEPEETALEAALKKVHADAEARKKEPRAKQEKTPRAKQEKVPRVKLQPKVAEVAGANYPHTCPACRKVKAMNHREAQELFGFRRMKPADEKVRIQPSCRKCRAGYVKGTSKTLIKKLAKAAKEE